MLMGGAVCMLISFARSERLPASFEPVAVWSLIYLITFGSILSYTAYMHVLRNVRPALASSYAFINPIVGITAGYLIAGETVTPIALVSVGIIITGVVLMTLVKRDDRRTTKDE
jgi:drug/metabolite transporter (DMT)-like permease